MNSYPIKVAFLVVDDRFRKRAAVPIFGAAPEAILESLATLGDAVEVHVISCTLGQDESILDLAPNIRFHPLNVPRIGMIKTLHLGCYLAVARRIRQIDPDIIHAQGTERWCAWVASFFPQPKVLTIHGNLEAIDRMMKMKPRWYWKLQTWMQTSCIGRFDGVFCNSLYTQSEISPRARRTWLVPNPLRPAFFADDTHNTQRRKILLNIGIFQPRKRQMELLVLARRMHETGSEIHFRFIGSLGNDPYGMKCRAALDHAAKAGFASHAGVLGIEALIAEMDAASGIIHVPLEEAFGLVAAEGIARGLTFFGTDVGGIKDITKDVEGTCLIPVEDVSLLEQPLREWEAGGCAPNLHGVKAMARRYSQSVVGGKHLEIYQKLVNHHGP